jgi:hypothetical protein
LDVILIQALPALRGKSPEFVVTATSLCRDPRHRLIGRPPVPGKSYFISSVMIAIAMVAARQSPATATR